MTYAQYGLIQASDFNTLVGGNPTTTANTLNATWSTGGGQAGYGQTAVANVTASTTVAATNWASLINTTASAASHQGTSITSVSAPVSGGTISFLSAVPTNLQSIYTSRGNAASQGTTTANTQTIVSPASWNDYANFTFTTTFANGDAARYFFNAGGQLKFTCSHPNVTAGINSAFNGLASNVGTIVVSGQNSGSRTIVGVSYNGITKIGGGGSGTANTNAGYFGLPAGPGNANVFSQFSGTTPYTANVAIYFLANTNGTQGSNSDNGSVVTIKCVFDKLGGNGTVGNGSSVTCTIVPPATTFIANTWGTISLAGSNTAL